MLVTAKNISKALGARYLFTEVNFTLAEGEKIALIGRNGYGKTTLLKILSGEDHTFEGEISRRKGSTVTLTQQEHLHDTLQSPLEYILKTVPNFYSYKKILDEYEQGLHTNYRQYLQTLEDFTEKRYGNLESAVLSTLADFGIPNHLATEPLAQLSGGQKRYVEMTRMMFSGSDLLLIDEPTNHMDYQGKERFIAWMKSLKQTVLVVTHDRDVLRNVTKIMELKDKKIAVYKGNYDHYIAQNSTQTLTSVKLYSDQLNRLKEAKKKVEWGLRMRAKSKQWKIRYDHWLRDYEKIKAATVKPSFWIDQDSVDSLDQKVVDSYQKFKEKNIAISISNSPSRRSDLIRVRNLALGYTEPVFENVTFSLKDGGRVFIKGKNGAGKSTLVRTLLSVAREQEPAALQLDGEISMEANLLIGEYEQEISSTYLNMALEDAVRECFREKKIAVEDKKIKSLLAQYLFDPILEARQKVAELSGGQKARFQLIKMFIGEPDLLILDEPTNHLDLPSIEELENALAQFNGGIVYISHDSYFIEKMGGTVVRL